MLELTFAEQVKLVLGRKNMTIKQLAEEIEEKTGAKMSRQNLTQRLGRDNFQEQDMRMIAEILECPFHLSILGEVPEVPAVKVEVVKEEEKAPEKEVVIKEVIKEVVKEVEVPVEIRKEDIKPWPINQREITMGEMGVVSHDSEKSLKGEINPYSGMEYKTNTVRTHPSRIGYVQVYTRLEHKWVEMTEWAFLGYQERQKIALGKAYEEPTYLD